MYTLLHGFYKYLTQKDEFWVVILGLDNAGKTVKYLLFNCLLKLIAIEFVITDIVLFPDVFRMFKNKI